MRSRTQLSDLPQLLLFACGGILLISLFATVQMRVALGVTPTLASYPIPALVGALGGVAVGLAYQRVKHREGELNQFFDISSDMLCIANTDGRFLRLNPSFETILGWPLEEMLTKPFVDFIHPDDVDATLAEVAKLENGISTIQFENRYCCPDGTYKWLDWSAHPTPEGLIYAVAHDVTARKEMEETLRDSAKRLSAIVDTAVDGIITIDEQGRIETFNPAAEKIFGYQQAELIGQNVKMLMPSPYQEEHDGYLSNYRRTGERKIIGIGRQVAGLRKDGTTFPLELSVAESILDERRMFTGIVRDVTERTEQEETLRQNVARNRALLDVIPDAIMRVHRDGTTLDIKAPTNYESFTPVATIVGQKQTDFLPEPLASRAMIGIAKALDEDKLQVIEYEAEDGSETSIREARIIPNDKDEVTIMIRDVTEQKQIERAEQAAIISERERIARDLHDSVTQTLFSASIIADVLPTLWDQNPDRARPRLDELRELARGALAEMRTLLLELRPAVLLEAELEELLQQLVDALIGRARVQGELTIDGNINNLSEDVHVAVYRTVQEALNNIAKHADASHINVSLYRNQNLLEIFIRDDGLGFDTSSHRRGHFGLQNMYERMTSVGGTLHIESQPDEGTTVSIRLQLMS